MIHPFHKTFVGIGNYPDKYSAHCDPPPMTNDDPFCWQGPDRETLDEAIADALDHWSVDPVITD